MTATDWRVSITPSPRGDFVTLSGIRYNLTLHDGATVEDYNGLLATLEAIGPALFSAYGNGDNGNPPPINVQASNQPVLTAPRQSVPEGVDAEDVYGVGLVEVGHTFDVEIARAVATSTQAGKPTIDLYRPGNQYPFAKVNEPQFGAFQGITGIDGATFKGERQLDPPALMRFKVGKMKPKGGKHYIDFVGAASKSESAPASKPAASAAGWQRDYVLSRLAALYKDRWTMEVLNGMLDRLGAEPTLTGDQVIDRFMEKVEAHDPKAA